MRIIVRLRNRLALIGTLIGRHGGGLSGARAVAAKSFHILRSIGIKGLLNRARLAGAATIASAPPAEVRFAPPLPTENIDLRVGIMAHVFYPELADEFARALSAMPLPYTLLVSVVDEGAKDIVTRKFSGLPRLASLEVRVVPNRGRDIAPMMVAFRDEILALDLVCHIHTKKSLYTGSEQSAWRHYLVSSLLGSPQRIAWILGTFAADQRLGIVYPESHPAVPLWAHTWLSNVAACRDLARRLGLAIEPAAYIDFTAGSMFWARVDALRPLYDLRLEWSDFPHEEGQADGTLQHALERLLVLVARHRGLMAGILPADGRLGLTSEGARNWETYFQVPLGSRMSMSAHEADIVSLDVFDTLVLRPFLTPAGSRRFLARRVERTFGLRDFADLRARAEELCRMESGRDADLDAIYRRMATLPECRDAPVDGIRELELACEQAQLLPRPAVVDAADDMLRQGKRVVAVSDMYLDTAQLARVLPPAAQSLPKHWYVSCETGWRKDDGQAWKHLPAEERVSPRSWLHVGDNEHADIQLPHDRGFRTVHALRPSALFDVVPALRTLRPSHGSGWQDQLWLGLAANRFANIADRTPDAFSAQVRIEDPDSLGYLVIGPLLLDYLTWLSRLALSQGIPRILFLSREGHLLERGYRILRSASPALAEVEGIYLLASRRGLGTPSLRCLEDLDLLLGNSFNGSLLELLVARLGRDVADAAAMRLGPGVMSTRIFLPEMRARVSELLAPAFDDIAGIAEREREAYRLYWDSTAGPGLVADIGYAGSIQAHLSRLTGTTLSGAYFATNSGIEQVRVNGGWAKARYGEADTSEGPCAILENDLFLETVMTAPDGQFSHFEIREGRPHPIFLEPEQAPHALALASRIQDGALSFVRDACRVAGELCDELALDPELVQEPLRALGAGRWRAGDWISDLVVGDAFTGRGAVSAAAGLSQRP